MLHKVVLTLGTVACEFLFVDHAPSISLGFYWPSPISFTWPSSKTLILRAEATFRTPVHAEKM